MEALDHYLKSQLNLSASTHGQQGTVRTVMGRQLHFMSHPSKLFMLPYLKSEPLQDLDPESETFGEFFSLVDVDLVDMAGPIL